MVVRGSILVVHMAYPTSSGKGGLRNLVGAKAKAPNPFVKLLQRVGERRRVEGYRNDT